MEVLAVLAFLTLVVTMLLLVVFGPLGRSWFAEEADQAHADGMRAHAVASRSADAAHRSVLDVHRSALRVDQSTLEVHAAAIRHHDAATINHLHAAEVRQADYEAREQRRQEIDAFRRRREMLDEAGRTPEQPALQSWYEANRPTPRAIGDGRRSR